MSGVANAPRLVPDPLLATQRLPLTRVFYPLGHALELATDSGEIIDAAAALWQRYPKLANAPAVRLDIAVAPENAAVKPVPALPRGREHLISIIHGEQNFAIADLNNGFAFAGLTRDIASDHEYTAYHFLEPLAYTLLLRHITILHAACVALDGRGVLLAGKSGSGKTCLSYGCAQRGWTFLSGDACQFTRNSNGVIIGRPFSIRFRADAGELFPELRRYPVSLHLNGKRDIAPPVDELVLKLGVQAEVALIVFLRKSAASKPRVRPVAADEALNELGETIFVGDERMRREQREALIDLVETRPACELEYSSIDEAEGVLRNMAQ